MEQKPNRNRFLYEGLVTALAVGGFFVVLGLAIVLTPGIVEKTNAFFSDLTTKTYPFGSGTVSLPAPANPAAHIGFFTAVMNFF